MDKHIIDDIEKANSEIPLLVDKFSQLEQINYMKGSLILSTTISFILECHNWDEFIQFLEPIHQVDISGKSPTMPIIFETKQELSEDERDEFVGKLTFTALSGLIYPTLLVFHDNNYTEESLRKMIKDLKAYGHVVINGKLSFSNIKEGD